jgi:APA family basic amino acid/polyamine antiporter
LPRTFARLHPKYKTPYLSIIIFGLAAAILILPGIVVRGQEIDLLGSIYALAATFAFCSAHLSVMRLRFIEPNLYRPYRMPWNIKFGRDSIPVISVVGALAIGTVFTQLLSQNISNSTIIWLGWMGLGVITFVIYRRHRTLPLWEPLEVPPPPDREIEHLAPEPLPKAARYRYGRRERIAAHAAVAVPEHHHRRRRGWQLEFELFFARHGQARGVLIVMVFAAVSGFAVYVDLSKYDPFGSGLGWSPGLVAVAFMAAYLLNRSHAEQ